MSDNEGQREERIVPMRLQKFLARSGVASRRGSEDLMTAGRDRPRGAATPAVPSGVQGRHRLHCARTGEKTPSCDSDNLGQNPGNSRPPHERLFPFQASLAPRPSLQSGKTRQLPKPARQRPTASGKASS